MTSTRGTMTFGGLLLTLSLAFGIGDARAQASASFRMDEHVVNMGGAPGDYVAGHSASFRITLASIGEGPGHDAFTSASFRSEGGFVAAYPPPTEVRNLVFAADETTLTWSPERSAGVYEVYRDLITNLSGLAYGSCLHSSVASATSSDPSLPPASNGFFYLVTAKNRLGTEGTKGFNSAAVERPNPAPCP